MSATNQSALTFGGTGSNLPDPVTVARGGTGATTAAAAIAALGALKATGPVISILTIAQSAPSAYAATYSGGGQQATLATVTYLYGNDMLTLNCEFNDVNAIDVSNCPALNSLVCQGNNLKILNIARNPLITNLDANSCFLSVAQINAILAALVAAGLHNGTAVMNTQDTPAPPSGQGITDKATLVSRGWTVTTD